MAKRLLIINNHDSFTYNLVDLVRRLDCDFSVVNVENLTPELVQNYSHLLISPGPDVPSAYPQLFEILEQFHQSKAILGVCLGHQTLCQFFGAKLFNLAEVRHGQQRKLHQVGGKNRLLFSLPTEFNIGLYHSWAVSEQNFPAQLNITAYCDQGIIMAMEHKELPIFSVQFHPESYMSEQGENILRRFLAM